MAGILLGDPHVDPNSPKSDGETLLHVAAWLSRLGAVRLLLSRGGIRIDIESRGDSVGGLVEWERYIYKIDSYLES